MYTYIADVINTVHLWCCGTVSCTGFHVTQYSIDTTYIADVIDTVHQWRCGTVSCTGCRITLHFAAAFIHIHPGTHITARVTLL